jgi:hypothetical protein
VGQKAHIIITYSNLSGEESNIKNHANQIRYIMENAKLLGENANIDHLSLEFSDRSCDRMTQMKWVWPFLLFMYGVKSISLTHRRWCPDNTWHPPTGHNVLIEDLVQLLHGKCGDRIQPDPGHNYGTHMGKLEKAAKDYDDERFPGLFGCPWESMEIAS